MSVHGYRNVAYHQQDTDYYCGAACAQMVLDSIGAGLLDQDDLYTDNHSHSKIESGWYTAPDGLCWTLNDRRPPGNGPAGLPMTFVVFALATEDAISRKICWTIKHYKVAPVALVYGWDHWIVIRGYAASAGPTSSSDTSYTINSFDVNNPWPPVPATAAPPPHSSGDGCGGGGNRGVANENISYRAWKSTYMTGVPSGYWQGKFVAVCDPEPPAEHVGEQPEPRKRQPGDRLLEPAVAANLAIEGMREHGLYERDDWKQALGGTRPGDIVAVQRLDHPGSFYYVVPMLSGNRTAVATIVDARFGDYHQAVALPSNSTFTIMERGAALQRVAGRKIDLSDRGGRILVRDGAYSLQPTLVWRPCRESLSPFYPFYMFTVGPHRIYVRIDGEVFTALHTDDRGA